MCAWGWGWERGGGVCLSFFLFVSLFESLIISFLVSLFGFCSFLSLFLLDNVCLFIYLSLSLFSAC